MPKQKKLSFIRKNVVNYEIKILIGAVWVVASSTPLRLSIYPGFVVFAQTGSAGDLVREVWFGPTGRGQSTNPYRRILYEAVICSDSENR